MAKLGPETAGLSEGDEVIGFTNHRASHAEYVIVQAQDLTARPANVSWETAGSLAVAGGTACAAVHAVAPQPGETVVVVVAGAAGGVGAIAVQLVRQTGRKCSASRDRPTTRG